MAYTIFLDHKKNGEELEHQWELAQSKCIMEVGVVMSSMNYATDAVDCFGEVEIWKTILPGYYSRMLFYQNLYGKEHRRNIYWEAVG